MEAQLRELIPFLRDRNPQVRQIALSNLLAQTPTGSPHRNIFFSGIQGGGLKPQKENDILRDLKLLCRDQLNVAHDAFRALVNLSDSPLLVAPLSDPSFVNFIVSYIINPQSVLADLASMLLSNLTANASACSTLLIMHVQIIPDASLPGGFYATQSRCGTAPAPTSYPTGDSQNVLALPLLLDTFVQGALGDPDGDKAKRARKGDLHFLSSVFANITASPAGRNYFMTPYPAALSDLFPNATKPTQDIVYEYPLAKIISFTEHRDTIRRGGVASTIKNCAFHVPGHKALLSPDAENIAVPPSTVAAPGIDVLPALLLPLAGPEEFDLDDQENLPPALQFLPSTKRREHDEILRLTHVETLLLLCHTRWGRDYLRTHGTYEIVRAAHEVEKIEKISEHIERLVTLLKGDESAVIEEDEDHVHDDVSLAASPVKGAEVASPMAAVPVVSDDEDDKIEEV